MIAMAHTRNAWQPTRIYASLLTIVGMLTLVNCGDVTDSGAIRPIRLINDSSEKITVAWCGDDSKCQKYDALGSLEPGGKVSYKISSSEIILRLTIVNGSTTFLCRDNAEGSTVRYSSAKATIAMAYEECEQG